MDEARVREILAECGAVLTDDHFVYTRGDHGSAYVNKDGVYVRPRLVRELCIGLAQAVVHLSVEVVVGPEKGAISLAQGVACALWEFHGCEAAAVYAERAERTLPSEGCYQAVSAGAGVTYLQLAHDGEVVVVRSPGFVFKRGYDEVVRGKRTLIVEDILNTGGSVAGVVKLVRETGGEVVGVAALCNRGGVTAASLEVPELHVLLSVQMDRYPEASCPLCAQGRPVNTRVGKGADFLARKAASQ